MARVCIVVLSALLIASCSREEEMRTRVGDGERDSVSEVVIVEEWPEVEEVEVPWGVSEDEE